MLNFLVKYFYIYVYTITILSQLFLLKKVTLDTPPSYSIKLYIFSLSLNQVQLWPLLSKVRKDTSQKRTNLRIIATENWKEWWLKERRSLRKIVKSATPSCHACLLVAYGFLDEVRFMMAFSRCKVPQERHIFIMRSYTLCNLP